MSKSLVEMAADIVKAQCSVKSMSAEELAVALESTFKSLQALQMVEGKGGTAAASGEEQAEEARVSDLTPARSILKNKIICLECGQEFKILTTKHLRIHDLTGKEYRRKHGFKMSQPLSAKSLTESRKIAAQKRGLPENLRKAIAARKKKAAGKKGGKATFEGTAA